MTKTAAENFYLSGNYAPVTEEVSTSQLAVTGALPRELNGRYLRIGPNPRGEVDPATYHWFSGAGMVHGVRLREGRAEWYRSRFVESEGHTPNTNVLAHGGRILALVEAGRPPVEISPDLARMAAWDCDGTLGRGFTAHPKTDPVTGDMHAITYNPKFAAARYVVLDGDGKAKHTSDIVLDDGPMIHDMALTETRVVVLDLPVTLAAGMRRAQAGEPVSNLPFVWDDQHPARVGIMPLGKRICVRVMPPLRPQRLPTRSAAAPRPRTPGRGHDTIDGGRRGRLRRPGPSHPMVHPHLRERPSPITGPQRS
ncbi:Carotenoid cleavage oxygenase [Streptomyces lydicus]|nr:Carotenoid cleavage oxygenase [Streptomyces lydicus]